MNDGGDNGQNVAIVARIQHRVRARSIAANAAGGLVVFLFIAFAIPGPHDVHHPLEVTGLNAGLLALSAAIAFPFANLVLTRTWRSRTQWARAGREPTPRERELTLRFPISQQLVVAKMWGAGAVLFGIVNAFISLQLAGDVAITIAFGGLVTVALGYLLTEREMRPVAAIVLATGLPAKPQLPGVAERALWSWALGTGVVLLGIGLTGLGALLFGTFTVTQLAAVVLVLAVVGLLVGMVVTVGLAKSLAEPIEALRAAVSQVEHGDLDHAVRVDDASEIGLLQAGFNRMLAGLHERERLRDLFGRQVGEDVVRHALEHGVELGGEAREAAILFIDLRGSTKLVHERDPAEVVSLLNEFFALVVEVVAAHGGWVNKFEGDAALCAFGVPLSDESCADEALAAGRELAGALRERLPGLSAGIGISAGAVVAGNVGAARRFEYTVIGDAVNEAARLSELAKLDGQGLMASGSALAKARDGERERWRVARELTLRGRGKPTQIALPA